MTCSGEGGATQGWLSARIVRALAERRPIVALETAILTHGLPFPDNLETVRAMEEAVCERGAVPATIGILDGEIRVGLASSELERLARAGDAWKCSTRDLSLARMAGRSAGTTVAATLYVAVRAGIRFFATGGIGGVHRGGEDSFDISADLFELRRSPCCVVCSGPKAILDLPRTAELLETLSLTVVGFRTDRMPGFYVERTGLPVARVDTVDDLARLAGVQSELGWPGSLIVMQPPPADQALSSEEFEELLSVCRERARAKGISGPSETPYLLACLVERSGGRTLALNRALAVRNASLAAQIAVAAGGNGMSVV